MRNIGYYVIGGWLEGHGICEHKSEYFLAWGTHAHNFWRVFKRLRVHGSGNFSESCAALVSKIRHADEL